MSNKIRIIFFLIFIVIATNKFYNATIVKRPLSNTTEYLIAHDIYEGKENEIEIGGVGFKIPNDISMNVFTQGEIIPGEADTLTVYLDFSKLFDNKIMNKSKYSKSIVRTEIRMGGSENDYLVDYRNLSGKWNEVFYKPDWDLVEFHSKVYRGGWGFISYQSEAPSMRTPLGGMIQFRCSGEPSNNSVNMCRGVYQLSSGPNVIYYLSDKLMPYWKQVNNEIVIKINSFLKEEN